jgi:putative transposase
MGVYKAELLGIEVVVTEESYISKCSFLDNEPLQKQETYAGKRVKRGLFRVGDGQTLNSEIHGSGNIIRKVVPNAIAAGIEGVAVRPLGIRLYK